MEIEAHARLQVTVYSVTCLKMKTLYFTIYIFYDKIYTFLESNREIQFVSFQ